MSVPVGFHSLPDLGQFLSPNKTIADLGKTWRESYPEEGTVSVKGIIGRHLAMRRSRHQEWTQGANFAFSARKLGKRSTTPVLNKQ
jgi:hypothetical protein